MDYLFLDASFFRMHPGSPAEPVLAAWGISTDGKPVFIGEGATLSGGCADEDSENGIFDLNCPSGEWPEPCTRRISTLRARGWLQMTCRKPAVQGRADDQDPIPLKPAHRTAGPGPRAGSASRL